MNSTRFWLRVSIPSFFAALALAVTGALSPASAATATWEYYSDFYAGECIQADGATAYVANCYQNDYAKWHWGSESNTWQGHTMRRLVNNGTGDCLTTDDKTDLNAVWMSPCGGGRSGQFWTADNGTIQNQNGNYLSSDSYSTTLYSQPSLDVWSYWDGGQV